MAAVMETYDLMSRKYFIHATPTLFNAGTPRPQMSSCFLVHMKDDSIEGIFDTLKTCACISKYNLSTETTSPVQSSATLAETKSWATAEILSGPTSLACVSVLGHIR